MNEQQDDRCPSCNKCGAPVTTGLMAAFCPKRKECEFWTEGIEQFLDGWNETRAATGTTSKGEAS
jgi:phage FluMu protein Com